MKTKFRVITIIAISMLFFVSCGNVKSQKENVEVKNKKDSLTIDKEPYLTQLYINAADPQDTIVMDNQGHLIPITLRELLPKTMIIEGSAFGDINGDSIDDAIIVTSDSNYMRFPIFLFLGDNGSYKQIARNDSMIMEGGATPMPFREIKINYPIFTIDIDGGSNFRWALTYTFQYESKEKDWFLIKYRDYPYTLQNFEDFMKRKTIIKSKKDFGKLSFKDMGAMWSLEK